MAEPVDAASNRRAVRVGVVAPPDTAGTPQRSRHMSAAVRWRLLGMTLAVMLVALVAPRVATSPGFHRYADDRVWWGVPHAGDVLSNLPFVLAAGWAWWRRRAAALVVGDRLFAATVCAVAAIGIGSGGYHVAPSDLGLMADWLPIATAVMLLLSCVLEDRFGADWRVPALGVALAVGAVGYWWATGGIAGGDMRLYVAVQGGGILAMLVIAGLVPGRASRQFLYFAGGAFILARVAHRYDRTLLGALGLSGHTLKHIMAATAAWLALAALLRPRQASHSVPSPTSPPL